MNQITTAELLALSDIAEDGSFWENVQNKGKELSGKLIDTSLQQGQKRVESEIGKIIGGNQNTGNFNTSNPVPGSGNTGIFAGQGGPTQLPVDTVPVTKPPINIDSARNVIKSVPPVGWAVGVGAALKLLKAGWVMATVGAVGTYFFVNKVN